MEPKITQIPPEDPALVRHRDHVTEHEPRRARAVGHGPSEDGGSSFSSTSADELDLDQRVEPELIFGEEAAMKVVYLARGRSVDGDGYRDAGLFASRGKLGDSADDEMWVDEALFIVMAEARLGVSMARLRQLYGGGRKGGPIPGALRAERAAVDSKLAELDNLALLSEHVGIPQTTLRDAAKRGRERNAG